MTRRLVIAGLLAITGMIWVLQGLGYLAGSVMTGDPKWAYIGAALLVAAAALAATALRRRAP